MKKLILIGLIMGLGLGTAACGKKGDVKPPARQSNLQASLQSSQ